MDRPEHCRRGPRPPLCLPVSLPPPRSPTRSPRSASISPQHPLSSFSERAAGSEEREQVPEQRPPTGRNHIHMTASMDCCCSAFFFFTMYQRACPSWNRRASVPRACRNHITLGHTSRHTLVLNAVSWGRGKGVSAGSRATSPEWRRKPLTNERCVVFAPFVGKEAGGKGRIF